MKAYQVGVYDGSEDDGLNRVLQHVYYEIETGKNIKELSNLLRRFLDEDRFLSVCKHKEKELFIVRVFGAVADETTVVTPKKDELGLYMEI